MNCEELHQSHRNRQQSNSELNSRHALQKAVKELRVNNGTSRRRLSEKMIMSAERGCVSIEEQLVNGEDQQSPPLCQYT
jgi:hypothetical protein